VWDGNTEGRDSIDVSLPFGAPEGSMVVYKISDELLTPEQIKVGTVFTAQPDNITVSADRVIWSEVMPYIHMVDYGSFLYNDNGDTEDYAYGTIFVVGVAGDFTDSLGIFIPSVGTYCMQGVPHFLDINSDTYHTLDNRFLPDTVVDKSYVDHENQKIVAQLENKLNRTDPVVYGTFSMNRQYDSEVGAHSSTLGQDNTASGYFSHAEGSSTVSSGNSSHTEGIITRATADASHAEGYDTTASGKYSHAEGQGTIASSEQSHAEGLGTDAEGAFSHAEGSHTTASGKAAHTEGSYTTASGESAHTEGSYTAAYGDYSHAEGKGTIASAATSHAEGKGTIASVDSQHVQGKFNVEDIGLKYAHIVGNGGGGDARSNAHTIDWYGNAWFRGDVLVGGTGQDDPEAEAVLTESQVKALINDAIGVIENGSY
jgi:hypothetical protein